MVISLAGYTIQVHLHVKPLGFFLRFLRMLATRLEYIITLLLPLNSSYATLTLLTLLSPKMTHNTVQQVSHSTSVQHM